MTQTICAALVAAVALTGPTPASAAEYADGAPTRVAFAGFQAIYDWRADDQGALLLRTASDHYYRATFAAPCPKLPTAISIGFITEVAGPLDRWSSIYVDGDRCWFKTFDPVERSVFESH